MSSKLNPHLVRSRSFIYASRLSRISPSYPEPIPLTPEKVPEPRQFTPTKSKAHLHDKIDSILKHNSNLLSENNKLVELIRDKDNQLILLQNRIDQLERQISISVNSLKLMQIQKNKLFLQSKQEQSVKESEISQLLTHTDMLKSKLTSLQSQHKIQLINIRESLSRQQQIRLQNAKRTQLQSNDIHEMQIQKMKELIQSNNREFESRIHENSMNAKQQEQEIRMLTIQIKHARSMNEMGMQESKMNYQNSINQIKRDLINKHEKEVASYEMTVKRLKMQISQKQLQVSRLNFQIQHTKQNNKAQYDFIQRQKIKSEIEMERMQIKNKELLKTQKVRMEEISKAEMENMKQCNNNYLKALMAQNMKMVEINNLKTQEIVKLQTQIIQLKQTNQKEIHSHQILNKTFQDKLYHQQVHNQQESELLKVKMSQLHSSDISELMSNYENQIVKLCDRISQLEKQSKECKWKLHKQLQQKTELRKHYQIEISKIHNKNIELKLQIQAKQMEMKENNEIVISKHNIISQGHLTDKQVSRRQKDKTNQDNKRLQELIISKDTQIITLEEKLQKLKNDFEQEIQGKNQQTQVLKTINKELIEAQKKEKQFYQKQLRKKQEEYSRHKETLEEELSTLRSKTYESLIDELQQVQKQKIRLESLLNKQINHKQMLFKSNVASKQMNQILRLESSAALQQQKSKADLKMSKQEQNFNNMLKTQIQSKNKEIEELKRRLLEKNEDLEESQNRERELQNRLSSLMQLLRSRSQLQNRVMNIGMDNNLLKNKSELFKK